MQFFYRTLEAIDQQTHQLSDLCCPHCASPDHLISHGFIYKKQTGAAPKAVGKRVYCSQRNRHAGCGHTVQLYLDATLRYLHRTACQLSTFILSLLSNATVAKAYHAATGTADPRNAWRWLHRLEHQTSEHRSLHHQPARGEPAIPAPAQRPHRRAILNSTLGGLQECFPTAICAGYQQQLQRHFL